MNDFKLMARLLAAIRAGEGGPFNCALVDERVLKATAKDRDRMALKLQKAGYIEGLFVIDDVDNQPAPVILWANSSPAVTLEGMAYMQENNSLRKAYQEIRDIGVELASKTVANVIAALAEK